MSKQTHVPSVFFSFPILTTLLCLAEDAFMRRHSYSYVFADFTSLQNLDDEEDGTGATGVIAFDTSS